MVNSKKLADYVLRKMAYDVGQYKAASTVAAYAPKRGMFKRAVELASAVNEEQRKQQMHELAMDHQQKKQQLELQSMQFDLERDQMEHQMKMQDLQQQQELKAQQQEAMMQQGDPSVAGPPGPMLTDDSYKANLAGMNAPQDPNMMPKAGAYEDEYMFGPQRPFIGKLAPMLAGAGLGAVGANLFPTEAAKSLFSQAGALRKGGAKLLSPEVLNTVAKGVGANIKRVGIGAGGGLLAGLLAHEMLD